MIWKKNMDYLNNLKEKGGILKATESGWFQADIARSAYKRQRQIDEGKRVVIGSINLLLMRCLI
jgi:methylmalonyl-CoA mutase N-terminal domain/subunit